MEICIAYINKRFYFRMVEFGYSKNLICFGCQKSVAADHYKEANIDIIHTYYYRPASYAMCK